MATPMHHPRQRRDALSRRPSRFQLYLRRACPYSYYGIVSNTLATLPSACMTFKTHSANTTPTTWSTGGCTDMLRDNLQNDPPVEFVYYFFLRHWRRYSGGLDCRCCCRPNSPAAGCVFAFQRQLPGHRSAQLHFPWFIGRWQVLHRCGARNINHPYLVDPNILMEGDFGPLLGWRDGQYDEAETAMRSQ